MKKVDILLKDINMEPVKIYENAGSLKRAILDDNSKKSGIYRWVHNETGESYVGSGSDLSKRLRSYYQQGELENSTRHIDKALAKHGHDKFSLEILEYTDKDKSKLLEREQFYLDEVNPTYNILKQAYSLQGFKHSDETIDYLKNREFSDKHKENLSTSGKGRIFSEEHISKLSDSLRAHHKEHPLSPEAFENIKQKPTEREGVSVVLTDTRTGEEKVFNTQTEAGAFLGITRQAIKKGLDRDSLLQNVYKVKRSENVDGVKSTPSSSVGDGKDFPAEMPSYLDDID